MAIKTKNKIKLYHSVEELITAHKILGEFIASKRILENGVKINGEIVSVSKVDGGAYVTFWVGSNEKRDLEKIYDMLQNIEIEVLYGK